MSVTFASYFVCLLRIVPVEEMADAERGVDRRCGLGELKGTVKLGTKFAVRGTSVAKSGKEISNSRGNRGRAWHNGGLDDDSVS